MIKFLRKSRAGQIHTTLIAQGAEIQGSIRFSGVLEIEGVVNGDIASIEGSNAVLRVLGMGTIVGNINVPLVTIDGRVVGTIWSDEHVELAANAVVVGDVHYSLLEMMRGAQVTGSLVFKGLLPDDGPEGHSLRAAEEDNGKQP